MLDDVLFDEVLAATRPDLPRPLELPALTPAPPFGKLINAVCQNCKGALTTREYFPDYSYEGESEGGSSWSGGEGFCKDCK